MARATRILLGLLTFLPILNELAAVGVNSLLRFAISSHFSAFAAAQVATTALAIALGLGYSAHAGAARDRTWTWRLGWAAVNLAPVLMVFATPVLELWAALDNLGALPAWAPRLPGNYAQAGIGYLFALERPLPIALALALPGVSLTYWLLHVRRGPAPGAAAP